MSEVPSGTPVAVAWAETDLGPAATARIQNREVFQADLSIQGPIPSFHKNAKVWFDYFDDFDYCGAGRIIFCSHVR